MKLALMALLLASPVHAGVASLVRDITPQNSFDEGRSANPAGFSAVGNRLVFGARDDVNGFEIWASDGTAGGTAILEDACPGDCGYGQLKGSTSSASFWVLENTLWRSDGTRAGTFPILDGVQADEDPWVTRGNVLYFPHCPGFTNCGLWRTDGTMAGTREVLTGRVRHLALLGERVLAATEDEILRLDPGSETPVLVAGLPFVEFLATIPGKLLIAASNTSGQELWATDGTPAGTVPVTSFANAGPLGHEPEFAVTDRRFYFVADDIAHGNELWVSDGTVAGTRRITDFGYYFPFEGEDLADTLQEAGSRVVFAATDGLSDELQLWSTDGRPESTTKLVEPCVPDCFPHSHPYRYTTARAGNLVFFLGTDAEHGVELWATDGTVKGTRLFLDLCAGSCHSSPVFVPSTPKAPGLFFFAAQGHLWQSDGTTAGTRTLHDLPLQGFDLLRPEIAGAGGKTFLKLGDDEGGWLALLEDRKVIPLTFDSGMGSGSDIQNLVAHGGQLYFQIESGLGNGIWTTGGTAETTRKVESYISTFQLPIIAGGVVYFFDYHRLYRLTESGAVEIAEISDELQFSTSPAAALGPYLYFGMNRGSASALWRTDGTAAGTDLVLNLPAGLRVAFVTESGGRLYFGLYSEDEGDDRLRLWASDGTPAGTRELLILAPYNGIDPRFVHAGGYDYFLEAKGFYGDNSQLWRTDGTVAGTVAIPLSSEPVVISDGMIAHQGSVYLLGGTGGVSALWRVEGLSAVLLGTFAEHPSNLDLGLASAGSAVVFSVDDGEHGVELWATDGTPAGTRLLKDIAPGPFSSNVGELTSAGGRAFFTAHEDDHGTELWESDGTAAGTRLVHDIFPGASSSKPSRLTAAEGRLYFVADDGLAGRELWTLPLSGSGCQPSARALCLQGGRFRVEASWRDFQRNSGAGTAVSLTGDTGYFWFFDPSNAEVILKVLDGRGLNEHFWVFYGALSTVEYVLTVTDTQTGLTTRYLNPMGQLASVGDTTGFGPLGAFASPSPSPPALIRKRTTAATACEPGPERLCLNGGRFAVEASWKDFAGKEGKGKAVPLSGETGYFWFFDAANVEVLLKVLDGRPVTGKFWVFYGALSNVEYTLTVTDTLTGQVKEYRNPAGRFGSVADTGAF